MRQWFRDPVEFMERNRDRHGPVFAVKLGSLKRCAFVADPAAAWDVLSGDPGSFRMGPTNRIFRPVLGERSLFLLDGAEHKHHRRLLAPSFHPRAVRGYAGLIEEIAAREMTSWPVDEPSELQRPMRRITTESIVRIVIGVCSPERDSEIRNLVREMLRIAENPLALMPQFRRELGGRTPFGKVMEVTRRIDEILRDESGRRRLLRHPVIHARLLAELDSDDGAYLDAVVRETLRQRPVLPVTARRITGEQEVGEFSFPSGWTLLPCFYLIHHDPEVFPEPELFRPERFLEEPKPSSRVYLPFGAGTRHCVGSHLALMTIKSVLKVVLSRAVLEADREPEPIVRNNMTLAPGRGATAVLRGRRGTAIPRAVPSRAR
jgi:cytochrome P450